MSPTLTERLPFYDFVVRFQLGNLLFEPSDLYLFWCQPCCFRSHTLFLLFKLPYPLVQSRFPLGLVAKLCLALDRQLENVQDSPWEDGFLTTLSAKRYETYFQYFKKNCQNWQLNAYFFGGLSGSSRCEPLSKSTGGGPSLIFFSLFIIDFKSGGREVRKRFGELSIDFSAYFHD